MKNKVIWLSVCFFIVLSIVFASCAKTPTISSTSTVQQSLSTTQQPVSSNPVTKANWWDKYGTPQYGGTITVRTTFIVAGNFDPLASPVPGIFAGGFAANAWGEALAMPDWTLDRSTWSYSIGFAPLQYLKGLLAQSWEQTDPLTITVHLRQGITWQNKPPVNGREITADDIVFNYDRLLGTGNGYNQPNLFYISRFSNIKKAVAVDRYTVQFQLNQSGVVGLCQILLGEFFFVPPEWVALGGPPSNAPPAGPPGGSGGPPPGGPPAAGGPLTDWKNVVGSSPWVLTDFVNGSKMEFSRNPDYWGYDERYPKTDYLMLINLLSWQFQTPQPRLQQCEVGRSICGLIQWVVFLGSRRIL